MNMNISSNKINNLASNKINNNIYSMNTNEIGFFSWFKKLGFDGLQMVFDEKFILHAQSLESILA